MHAEQYKLLDTLILLEAQGVVTHYKSLGGLFLNEYRHMLYKGQRSMTRVQTQVCAPQLETCLDWMHVQLPLLQCTVRSGTVVDPTLRTDHC